MNSKKGYFAILAGALWGSIGFFVRYFSGLGMASMDITFMRMVTACVMIFLYIFLFDRSKLKIHPKDWWIFAGNGILSLSFFFFCYNRTIELTSLSTAAVLLYTAPAFVMVMSYIFFREELNRFKGAALVLTLIGCLLVSGVIGENAALTPAGILCGLGAGFGYALYSIFSRCAFNRGYSSETLMFYTYLSGMIGTCFAADLTMVGQVMLGSLGHFATALLYSLLSTILPYIFYNVALRYADNGRCSIMASVEPVVATLCGFLFFGEKPTFTGIAGMLLVLGAVVLCNVSWKPKKGL